jgi:hypothetical protein
MTVLRCVVGTEAECDDIVSIVDKALEYPKRGVHVGGGHHVNMPATWDGTGATPPGWAKRYVQNWVTGPADAAVPLSDADVALLNTPEAQARLTVAERNRLAAKTGARSSVELEGRNPKANAAVQAAKKEES